MNKQFELLAPGGDVEACKAAIIAGADAIFCGLNKFNARNRAANIEFDDLLGIIRLAHEYNCEVFLTMNILLVESEFKSLFILLNRLVNTDLDGVIIQDIGLFHLLSIHFPTLAIHASTQTTTHNRLQMHFLKKLGAERANLSRELTISEIRNINNEALNLDMQSEVFVHGSNCLSFSGACFFSSILSGNSGNRGRCSQPCRDRYQTTSEGKEYPLNLKDNSAYLNLEELLETGVYSLKIEGRIKKSDYVYTVVHAFRKQLDRFLSKQPMSVDMEALNKVFNRDFTNAYLTGHLGKSVFIDNPRDFSVLRLAERNKTSNKETINLKQKQLLDEKEKVKHFVEDKIAQVNTEKIPLHFHLTGAVDKPLYLEVKGEKFQFTFQSRSHGSAEGKEAFTPKLLQKRLKAIEETAYCIDSLYFDSPEQPVFYSFKELNDIKKQLLLALRKGKKAIAPVILPTISKQKNNTNVPSLVVIENKFDQVETLSKEEVTLYFQLPSSPTKEIIKEFKTLSQNLKVRLYFPSIIMDSDVLVYQQLLENNKPKCIVTNNSGIAYEAFRLGIDWIAGPYFNVTNSYSLQALKERFRCKGAFVSNEMSQAQLYPIQAPDSFDLGYSLFHPSLLFTSRQCLFTQITGCKKDKMDESCLFDCNKNTEFADEKGNNFSLDTTPGNHHNLYSEHHFLNTEILFDSKGKFSTYLIDLTEVKNRTKLLVSKKEVIRLFLAFIRGEKGTEQILQSVITPTQYKNYKSGM